MAASIKEFSVEPFSTTYLKNAGCGHNSHMISCILCTTDRSVFIWDQYNSCIHGFPIETLFIEHQISDPPTEDQVKDIGSITQNQKYLCITPSEFEVVHLVPNACSSHVALVGKNDLSILELPSKTITVEDSGRLCKTIAVDQRFFQTHRKCMILKALWHPASPNDSHLSLLLSNNTIRTYSIHSPRTPHHIFSLSETSPQFCTALGESFISMDFGVPEVAGEGDTVVYPLFLLNHTGDVYKTQLDLTVKVQNMLEAPLPMLPAADDNYGSDACDITFLSRHSKNGSCQVLAIATASGVIYHCVLLSTNISEEKKDAGYSLYLYEQLEVAFVLITPDEDPDHLKDFEISSQIRLITDGDNRSKYFCMHSMGIHSVNLVWMDNFIAVGDDEIEAGADIDFDCAQVSHVLCTQPTQDSKVSPLRGLAVIPDLLDRGDTLFCILNDFTCAIIKLCGHVLEVEPTFSQLADEDNSVLPEHKPFINTIQQILQRSKNNPLIRTGSEQHHDMDLNYQLVTRSTKVYRDEYLSKLSVAKGSLDRRVNFLATMKKEQIRLIKELDGEKAEMKNEAGKLAERYEDLKYQNERILSRIEAVMSRIQLATDTHSKAELEFKGELYEQQTNVEQLEEFIDQVKRKMKFHKERTSFSFNGAPGFSLSNPQLKTINSLLQQESNDLSSMVQQVKDVKALTGSLEQD